MTSNVVELKPKPRNTGIVTTIRTARSPPTTAEIVEQLKAAIVSVGMVPPNDIVVEHGKMRRFKCHGRNDGWYVIYIQSTHVAGAFGSWHTGEKYNWRYQG